MSGKCNIQKADRKPLPFASCLFLLLLLLHTAHAQVPPAPWAVQGTPWRVVLRQTAAPADPDTGTAIAVPGLDTPGASDHHHDGPPSYSLTDAAGQALPVVLVWHGEGQSPLLLARGLKPGQDYFLYPGGPRDATNWSPKTSLLLEVRTLPPNKPGPALTMGPLPFNTLAEWQDAWSDAPREGATFVDTIFLGNNPFGEQNGFLSHFTGYLLPSTGADATFYTNSSTASFVLVNGQPFLELPGNHGPLRDFKEVHARKLPPGVTGPVRIDYYHVNNIAGSLPIMTLCRVINGHPEPIPADAWLHPGTSEIVRAEDAHGQPVPRPEIVVDSYMGWDGGFLYQVHGRLLDADPKDAATEWRFDDGGVFTGPAFERIMAGTPSEQHVTVRMGADANAVRVTRRLDFGGPPPTDAGNPAGRRKYLETLTRQDPVPLDLPALTAMMPLLLDHGTDAQVAPFAVAWLKHNPPVTDTRWLGADLARLRALAETDPRGALVALRADALGHAHYARALDLWETELLAFYLRDAASAGRIEQIAFGLGNSPEGKTAAIRSGDLARLTGDLRRAAARYEAAQPPDASGGRKLPAEDQANSITVQNLIDHDDRQDAMDRLNAWELSHPKTKFTSDFLLQHARALELYGRWNEALTELDSVATTQPDGPYQIDADFHRARALRELGKKDEARKIWADLIKNYPRSPLAAASKEWVNKP